MGKTSAFRWHPMIAVIASLAGAIHGCGSDDDKGSGAEDACAQLASAAVAYVSECFGGSSSPSMTEVYLRNCTDMLAAPGVNVDASNLIGCAAAYGSCTYTSTWERACAEPPGSLPVGSPCVYDEQCSSLFCMISSPGSCGVCAATLPAGTACTYDSHCVAGTTCANGVCSTVSWLPPGSPCESSNFTQYCDSGSSCIDGTCKLPGSLGVPCAYRSECEPDLVCTSQVCARAPGAGEPCPNFACANGLVCNAQNVCARPAYAAPGQACGYEIATYCEMGECSEAYEGTGICPAVLSEGAACEVSDDPGVAVCVTGLDCVAGKCAFLSAAECK